jgi:hypothetical protein
MNFTSLSGILPGQGQKAYRFKRLSAFSSLYLVMVYSAFQYETGLCQAAYAAYCHNGFPGLTTPYPKFGAAVAVLYGGVVFH